MDTHTANKEHNKKSCTLRDSLSRHTRHSWLSCTRTSLLRRIKSHDSSTKVRQRPSLIYQNSLGPRAREVRRVAASVLAYSFRTKRLQPALFACRARFGSNQRQQRNDACHDHFFSQTHTRMPPSIFHHFVRSATDDTEANVMGFLWALW